MVLWQALFGYQFPSTLSDMQYVMTNCTSEQKLALSAVTQLINCHFSYLPDTGLFELCSLLPLLSSYR